MLRNHPHPGQALVGGLFSAGYRGGGKRRDRDCRVHYPLCASQKHFHIKSTPSQNPIGGPEEYPGAQYVCASCVVALLRVVQLFQGRELSQCPCSFFECAESVCRASCFWVPLLSGSGCGSWSVPDATALCLVVKLGLHGLPLRSVTNNGVNCFTGRSVHDTKGLTGDKGLRSQGPV